MTDMKKILRSVLNVNDTIPPKDLSKNLWTLSDVELEFINPEDSDIWEYVRDYAHTYTQAPSVNSLRDYFEKQKNYEVLDRIEEVAAFATTYKKSDFENLIRSALKEQNERLTSFLLKDASNILTSGMTVGTGRQKQDYRGHSDALRYIMERADKVMMSDSGAVFRSDITKDAEDVRKGFANTLSNVANAWGRGTGLNEIDATCRGIKPGELWIHAAYTGELKCVQESCQLFNHTTKKLETIGELFKRGELPVVTALANEGEGDFDLVTAETSHLVQNGIRKVYRVKTKGGRELEITDNHPLWSSKGGGTWQELKDLSSGDFVGHPSVMRVPEPREDFTDAQVQLIGYMLGDGHSSSHTIDFAAQNDAILKDFLRCLLELGYLEGASCDIEEGLWRQEVNAEDPSSPQRIKCSSVKNASPLRILLAKLGLWAKGSGEKFIPGEMWGLPDAQVALLLGALWSTEGSCPTGDFSGEDRKSKSKRNDITYASVSKDLAQGVQGLLTRLGIESTVRDTHTTYKDAPYVFYTVCVVTNPSKKTFCKLIKVVGKEERFEVLRERLRDVDDRTFPMELISHLDRKVCAQTSTGSWRYADQAQDQPTITADGLRIFAQADPSLLRHVEGDVVWDQIESITLKGEEMTYDLSVPEHHSFVVNDFITHNTTFAINWAYKTSILFGYNVYYYSLEMPVKQLRLILYVMHSNHPKFAKMGYEPLSYPLIRDGVDIDGKPISARDKLFFDMVIEDMEQGQKAGDYGALIVECPDEANTTMQMVKSRIELAHQTTPIHIVFVDYLGLLTASRRMGDHREELNSIFREAKQMCLTFNRGDRIPMVVLHQINREGKKEADKNDGRYTTQALADSSAAERTADVITYTYLNDEYRTNGETMIGCIKNRDNPQFSPFVADIHFPSRFIKNIDTGNKTGTISLKI